MYNRSVKGTDVMKWLQRLKDKDDLDIYSIVSQIKTKQTFMVQNRVYNYMHAGLRMLILCAEM